MTRAPPMRQRLMLQRPLLGDFLRRPPARTKGKWKWLCISLAVHCVLLALFLAFETGRSGISSKSHSGNTANGLEVPVSIFKTSDRANLPSSKPLTEPNENPRARNAIAMPRPKPKPNDGGSAQAAPPTTTETNSDAAQPLKLSGDEAEIASNFQRQLLAYIEPYRHYPENAKSNRIEGSAQIAFTMDRSGRVLNISIVQTSGSTELDDEAIKTILRAQPLLPIPSDLPAPLNVRLPVDFKLQELQVLFAPENR